MVYGQYKKIITSILLLLICMALQAVPGPVILNDSADHLILNRKASIILTGPELSLEDAVSAYKTGNFTHPRDISRRRIFYNRLNYFLCFTFKNETPDTNSWFLADINSGLTRQITLFRLENEQLVPYSEKDCQNKRNVFLITLKPGEEKTYFLKISKIRFSHDIHLFTEHSYIKTERGNNLFFGFFYGIIFIMTFYNLMLFFSLKKKSYLFYILFNVFFGIQYFISYGHFISFFPAFPHTEIAYYIVRNVSMASLLFFTREFLRFKIYMPRIDKIFLVLWAAGLSATLFYPVFGIKSFSPVQKVLSSILLVCIILIFMGCIMGIKKRYRSAFFFLLAVFPMLSVICIGILLILAGNLFPFRLADLKGYKILELSQILMIVVFSFSLTDSINIIRSQKEKALKKMISQIKKSAEVRADKERLNKELELARQIQTALLPGNPGHRDFDIAARMIPATEVGGDYYDILYGKNNDFWISIGDVSGHGMTPGIIMMIAQTVYSTITVTMKVKPSYTVQVVNTMLVRNIWHKLDLEHMMSFTALKYLGKGTFLYAGLHLPMIVYRKEKGACEIIETNGMFLSLLPDITKLTDNRKFSLGINDILVLYTDGLTEARNEQDQFFDIQRVCSVVETEANQPADSIKESIIKKVMEWTGNKQKDDITLIVVKRVI